MNDTKLSPAEINTLLAIDRTRLAYERTMMAWVRTAVSLISFGFTIYKFFQYQIEQGERVASARLISPREFAMVMIGTGLAALVLASWQHHSSLKGLSQAYGPQPRSTAAVVGMLVALLGLLALAAAVFRA